MKRLNGWTAVALSVLIAAPPIASGCRHSAGQAIDDATLTVRVKTTLLNHPMVGPLKIDVETFKGVVSLSGTVHNKDEEATAIWLASTVTGVREVRSNLRISP